MPSKLMNERGGTCDLVTPKLCFSWWKQMQQNQLVFLTLNVEILTYNDQNRALNQISLQ